jgi:hypothetical protein
VSGGHDGQGRRSSWRNLARPQVAPRPDRLPRCIGGRHGC